MTTHETSTDFSARVVAPDPDEVWRRWTTPDTWGHWDKGLRSAELDGTFDVGATGVITGLDGRRSRFTIVAVQPKNHVQWEVALPLGSRMALTRTLVENHAEHRVQFLGFGARMWGIILGRKFRPLMQPTMRALVSPLLQA